MDSIISKVLVLFFAFLLGSGNAQDSTTLVPAIMTFGDSAVDVGNNNYLYTVFKANHLPYGKDFVNHQPTGRFCNGKLATDFTAQTLGFKTFPLPYLSPEASGKNLLIGVNFASAASGYDENAALLNHALSLPQQVGFFKEYQVKLAKVAGNEKAASIIKDALYLLSAGSGDFLQNYYINPYINKVYTPDQYGTMLIGAFTTFIKVFSYCFMGTKVQYESYLPGYHSMRDLNEDSHGCSWPLYYSEKSCQSGQYYNGILPRATSDAYLGCDRDAVKRTMLEHEAIFKNQVRELHRLYIKQRELMNDIKRSEQRHPIPVDISFSSSPLASQSTPDGARKWHLPSFPLAISSSGPSVPGVEDVKSSLSSLKENNRSDGLLPSQNGTSSKDCEVLESRPSNSRRKTFDLQLPADEYIDSEEGEVFHDEKVPPTLGCHSNGSKKFETQCCVTANLNLNPGEKSGGQRAALASDSCVWNKYGLADLNEPVQVEEANGSNFFDLPSARDTNNGETQGPIVSSTKQENFLSSSNEGGHATNRNLYIENGNRREAFPNIFEAGRSKESEKSFTRGQMEKFHLSSNPLQVPLNKYHELPVFYLNDKSKVQQDLDRPVSDLQLFKRSYEMSNAGDPGYVLASQTSHAYQIAPSLNVGKSWAHSGSSWEKSNGNSSQKTSGHTQPCFKSAAVHKSFPSSTQNNGIFGDRCHLSSDSRSNPGSGCENPNRNGFYFGSTSGSNGGVFSSTISRDHGANYYKGSGCVSTNSPKDINLNVVLPKSLSNEAGQQPNYRTRESDQNNEDHHNVLPWSRAVPAASKNETINSRRFSVTGELNFALSPMKQFSDRNETENGSKVICYPNIESNSHCSNNEPRMSEHGECQSSRKLLGFPIFEGPHISKNESFSLTSPSASLPNPSENEMEGNRKTRVLDINLPCDPSVFESDNATNGALAVENGKDTKVSTVRVDIDLNSCVSDEEPSIRPLPLASSSGKERVVVEIDLEAPAMPETEDDIIVEEESLEKQHEQQPQSLQHKAVDIQDDLMSLAAEAILAISSCGYSGLLDDSVVSNGLEDSSSDTLNWFAEIVSTHGDDEQTKSDTVLRSKEGKETEESSLRGIDYFEYMTLRQAEVDEEHYMPKPLVPENMEIEDTGTNLLQNRPRKGQTRRGRQRRDFQKDILPGLSSLSRHEVTEDLQTFGGLMRATGHSWHSGVTRRNSTRNGCGRGRRRSVTSPPPPVQSACNQLIQQLSNIEMGLEDGSLTGWGKTTRRPRRQRCPAGNPPAVPLT